jgi:AcrR family transcriptional regulator
MAPEDRRAALIEACVPLLEEHGIDISTKQIAAAAGVAEGTIFGVFKDKSSLVTAAMMRAVDPQPTIDRLAAVDRSLGLRDRLIIATEIAHERSVRSMRLLQAARMLAMSGEHAEQTHRQMHLIRERLHQAVADLIEPDAAELRRSPAETARMLLMFTGANIFGPYADPDNFRADELVSLLLDGLLVTQAGSFVVPTIGNGEQ